MFFSLFPSVYPSILLLLLTIRIQPGLVGGVGASAHSTSGGGSDSSGSHSHHDIPQEEGQSLPEDNSFSGSSSGSDLELVNYQLEEESPTSSYDLALPTDGQVDKSKYNVMVSYSEFGSGEMGSPLFIENPDPEQSKLIATGYRKYGFNDYISGLISINRTLPDYRSAWCQKLNLHSRNLLSSSVIISVYNEAWSTLIRTIHSVLDRTPATLLSDIVLVDDASTQEHLKGSLDEYIKTLPKVKLLRLRRREGLIRARIIGASNAEGPVLTFLDSHVEVTEGWLEPLVDRITRNKTNVVAPVIDVIDPNTLEYRSMNKSATMIGSFLWTLQFRWRQAPDDLLKSLRSPDDPLPTPVLGSGMFSIHKDFFHHIGRFDENYEIWGGEMLEMSFKTWMCGGRLEIAPCSHIGHIHRKAASYSRTDMGSFYEKNLIRLAAVWLDEYAPYFFKTISNQLGDLKDIGDRIGLKKRLKCKSFDWYMKNVAFDHFNPKNAVAEGEIRNLAYGGYICLDSPSTKEAAHKPVAIYDCHNMGGNQLWYHTSIGELRRDDLCLDFSGLSPDIIMYPCHRQGGNQQWLYSPQNGFIIHGVSRKCLALDDRETLTMTECEDRITQRWQMEHYNEHNAKKILLLENKSFKNPK